MARPLKGAVIEKRGKDRSGKTRTVYAIRYTGPDHKRYYQTTDAKTRADAETELADTLTDIRRGRWHPPTWRPAPTEARREDPGFHAFASEWLHAREAEGLAEKTLVAFHWSIEKHLLPFFKDHLLSEITVREVDRYKTRKAVERQAIETERAEALKRGERFTERPLGNGSINHTLRHLAQILESAVEYGLLETNPAAGKRRRLKASRPGSGAG